MPIKSREEMIEILIDEIVRFSGFHASAKQRRHTQGIKLYREAIERKILVLANWHEKSLHNAN